MEKKRIVKKPRGKSRKKEMLKKTHKRKILINRLSIIIVLLGVLSGIVYGVYFLMGSLFSVKEIIVDGNTMYSDTEILNASSFKRGDALLFINTSEAEKKIYKSFPYVDDVKIHKQFPNKLKINISTAIRRFSILKDDVFYVISERKKFLETVSELPSETLELRGVEFEIDENGKVVYSNSDLEETLAEIINEVLNVGLNGIRVIDFTNPENIVMNYEDRISIIVGSKQDLHYKMVTAKEIITNKINQPEKGELDLRDLTKGNKSYFTPIN